MIKKRAVFTGVTAVFLLIFGVYSLFFRNGTAYEGAVYTILSLILFSGLYAFRGQKTNDERGTLIRQKAGFYSYIGSVIYLFILVELFNHHLGTEYNLLQLGLLGVLLINPIMVFFVSSRY